MRANEVRRIRRKLGLKQTEFAKRLGVHAVTVSRWETGAWNPSVSMSRFMRLLLAAKKADRG
jgi:putative zinc finger/helix-turn-helix YgiT family protein